MKSFIRKTVLKGASALGVNALYRSSQKNRFVILMYHGIVRRALPFPCWWQLSIDQFQWQMNYLKKNYNVISLKEVVDKIHNRIPLDPNTAVITFDDGYHNNYSLAYPILKELNLPASIFLVTDFIGQDQLLWAINQKNSLQLNNNLELNNRHQPL